MLWSDRRPIRRRCWPKPLRTAGLAHHKVRADCRGGVLMPAQIIAGAPGQEQQTPVIGGLAQTPAPVKPRTSHEAVSVCCLGGLPRLLFVSNPWQKVSVHGSGSPCCRFVGAEIGPGMASRPGTRVKFPSGSRA